MTMTSSISFADKYRPKTLKDVCGQKDAIDQIKGFIKNKTIPKTLLITGLSGVGKTTLGRIIANIVNGNDDDTIVFEAGTKNSIDDVRSLVQQIKYRPKGNFRIIVIDECHVLNSVQSNPLLRALEEPPVHCIFILVTNMPEKMQKTIVNRCEKINLTAVSQEDIKTLLEKVCKAEKIKFGKHTDKVLEEISISCEGIPREALQMLSGVWNKFSGSSSTVSISKIIQSLVPETGKNATYILVGLYKNKEEIFLKGLQNESNYHGLLNTLFDINRYVICQLTGAKTYHSEIRKQAYGYLKNAATLKKALKIHRHIVRTKDKMGAYLIPEQDLFIAYLSEALN